MTESTEYVLSVLDGALYMPLGERKPSVSWASGRILRAMEGSIRRVPRSWKICLRHW